MATLYVIGNGFDRAHGLKTAYWDFRNYLEKYAPEFLVQLENMYSIAPFERLDKRFKKNKNIQNMRDDIVYKTLWRTFEYDLGEANEAEMLDFSSCIVDDLDLDGGPVGILDTMDVYWEEQYSFIQELNEYVHKWIRQVRLHKAVPMKTSFVNNTSDYFFTFNYTNVLERIYGVPSNQILHIHGGLSPYCDVPPILGHGNKKRIDEYLQRAEEASEEFEEGEESIYKAVANYYKRTLKDTDRCMLIGSRFFNQLSSVDNVEVIGQSFGEVDMPYLTHLQDCISDNAYWKFFYHTPKDYVEAQNAVAELNLDGTNSVILHSDDFWK